MAVLLLYLPQSCTLLVCVVYLTTPFLPRIAINCTGPKPRGQNYKNVKKVSSEQTRDKIKEYPKKRAPQVALRTISTFSALFPNPFIPPTTKTQARPEAHLTRSPIERDWTDPSRPWIICSTRDLTALLEVMPVKEIAHSQPLWARLLWICKDGQRRRARRLGRGWWHGVI
jgi:hypothetical protein